MSWKQMVIVLYCICEITFSLACLIIEILYVFAALLLGYDDNLGWWVFASCYHVSYKLVVLFLINVFSC
ncbi:hypothetical protein HanPSC8_Chr16g0709391 [Helianthus annuus]|nr:hypothetical protein HanPSC8_Chr16g0709391 [Helianthus annuus]